MSDKTHLRRWDAIAKRCSKAQPVLGAEVGVWKGTCSAKLLQLLPKLTLHMVDRWKLYTPEERSRDKHSLMAQHAQSPSGLQGGGGQKIFDDAYAETKRRVKKYGKRAMICKKPSAEAALDFKDASLDFVFIDGDHSYEGVSADIKLWLPKVKPGGWLCGHDYTPEGKRPGVTRAVNEALGEAIKQDVNTTWFYKVPEICD